MNKNHGPQGRGVQVKRDFDQCLARVYAWYERKIIDRPPVRFHHHNLQYERHRTVTGSWRTIRDRWLDVDFQVKAFVKSLEGTQFLGETFPIFMPDLSAVVYNLFLGQEAKFGDETVWVNPWVDDLANPPPLRIQWDNVYFRTIEALTQRALEYADGRFLVGLTDLYAGIDCTAGLRGAERMCLDLVQEPDGIKRLINLAFAEYPAVYNHFDRILKAHGQRSVTWMNLPTPGTFNVLACDFSTNISRNHFDEFCMPILRKEAALFTHNVFHLDGPGVAKNIDSILSLPNLVAVQWVQGYGKDAPILRWIPLIEKIQKAGKCVIVDLQLDELDAFMRRVDPLGILLWIAAEPKDQETVIEHLKGW